MRMTENLVKFSFVQKFLRRYVTYTYPIRCIKFSENRTKIVDCPSRHGVEFLLIVKFDFRVCAEMTSVFYNRLLLVNVETWKPSFKFGEAW